MNKVFKISAYFLVLIVWVSSCRDDANNPSALTILEQTPNLPSTQYNYANLPLPPAFDDAAVQGQLNTPTDNPVTDAGATLGRVLFYDKNMSVNNTIACASCHVQAKGFSDSNTFSLGFEGGETPRHSMGLTQAAYYNNGRYFWDERAASLEDQVLMPIQDHIEMGMDLETLVDKLQRIDYYPALFQSAFGTEDITSDRISKALAQFVRSIVSYQSKYDQGLAVAGTPNPDFPNFTPSENLGKALFISQNVACAACHGTINFVAPGARNNGLDADTANDQGVGSVTGLIQDNGHFKSNSLRNVAVTAPFMHDGRFQTLLEVINHYDSGVQDHPTLSPPLRGPNGGIRKLNLTENEKQALIDFLHTLTDDALLNDPKYSDPF